MVDDAAVQQQHQGRSRRALTADLDLSEYLDEF